jgi:hypothetical protein
MFLSKLASEICVPVGNWGGIGPVTKKKKQRERERERKGKYIINLEREREGEGGSIKKT